MNFDSDLKYDFKDVLIRPKRSTLSSRKEVDLLRDFNFKQGQKMRCIPIIAANMDTIGTFEMAKALEKHCLSAAIHKHYAPEDLINFFSNKIHSDIHWYTLGISESDLVKFDHIKGKLSSNSIPNICIDVANGYQESFVEFIKRFRDKNHQSIIMAGNIVTGEMTEALLLAGADIVKVGIGSGSVCTTRIQTGVGYPQLSAIIECSDAAHGLKGYICADGGITVPGDFGKAFGGGADFCMAGGIFSGHNENPGNQYYGMSSIEAMEKHYGFVADYRSSEGRSVLVQHKGPVEDTIRTILGGLRSTCTYVGAGKLKELSKRTTFIRVSQQYNQIFEENPTCHQSQ